jgi:hypothetical protein
MIIVDPITLGDTSFSRPSVKNVYNGAGTLVEVPANTLGVTYDPADLSKAPWALIEPAAPQLLRYTEDLDNTSAWGGSARIVTANAAIAPTGTMIADRVTATVDAGFHYLDQEPPPTPFANGEKYTFSVFARAEALSRIRLDFYYAIGGTGGYVAAFDLAAGTVDGTAEYIAARGAKIQAMPGGWFRCSIVGTVDKGIEYPSKLLCRVVLLDLTGNGSYSGVGAPGVFLWGWNLTPGDKLSSYIASGPTPLIRAADVIGSVAGLLYSNVPITEPDYNAAATYAKDALVHDPATHNVFKSLIDANKGKALTDPAAWNPRGATNRWAMLDQYNNTQTVYPEEILIVLTPQAISEGLYIGNCEADEIELSVVDQSEGLVASEVMSLVTASGTSSYFDWCFRPADRSDYFVTTSLPPYANALVLVAIRKPGGVPKCGMLAIGGVDDFGPSLYGLSAEGKDYSSTTFNFDGTTNTELRPYAKRMSVDVQVDNGEIDYIQRKLFQIRQRPVVWIGGPYGATAVFGRYGSFKIVIPGLKKSDMALQIEGSV